MLFNTIHISSKSSTYQCITIREYISSFSEFYSEHTRLELGVENFLSVISVESVELGDYRFHLNSFWAKLTWMSDSAGWKCNLSWQPSFKLFRILSSFPFPSFSFSSFSHCIPLSLLVIFLLLKIIYIVLFVDFILLFFVLFCFLNSTVLHVRSCMLILMFDSALSNFWRCNASLNDLGTNKLNTL
jgi:hypothetical protein